MYWHYHKVLPSLPYFFSLRQFMLEVEGGGLGVEFFKRQTKRKRGKGGSKIYLYVHSVKKVAIFINHQIVLSL